MSNGQKPTEIYLKDYTPSSHLFDKTDLTFELLAEDNVVVTSKITARPNTAAKISDSLILDGAPASVENGSKAPTMQLLEIKVNGRVLAQGEYSHLNDKLTIHNLPNNTFTFECKTCINPKENRSLSGLYTSGGKFVTQCESQGFRNITFYLDRPDILSRFTTTIVAEKGKYEQLLSNGNPSALTGTTDGRETITWEDPFAKPCYLFAMVTGNLVAVRDSFKTKSGRNVDLVIYTDKGDESKVSHAMISLKKAMKWDEVRFGREYDLELFQIVAVNDFNFGAMENKGLNIFNSSAILADPHTATDARYEYVEAVVGHEYFHNWSGNRVTCRDWFQLSLKEGFTVFRDAEFTADMNSRPVKRIDDVIGMRTAQFSEDAGAMAHPIRPASVGSIENFYTATVYQKGAEVIGMIHTLLGEEAFRAGSDLYFERHDGQAVTTEDFVKAMHDGAKSVGKEVDLRQFEKSWYNQAGTPMLDVSDSYNIANQTYHLTIKQSTPATPGQPVKEPFHIPVKFGLLGSNGDDMPLKIDDSQATLLTGDVLNLKEAETTFIFNNIPEKPLPSLLRNWSAPVKINYQYSRKDLAFLMANDKDGFNRWDAGQKFAVLVLKELIEAHQKGNPKEVDSLLIEAFGAVLKDRALDLALAARAIKLPGISYLSELYPDGQVDVDAIYKACKQAYATIGRELEPLLLERFNENQATEKRPYDWNVADTGARSIKNTALSYLTEGNPEKYLSLSITQFDLGHNITDTRNALGHILNYADVATRTKKLQDFYQAYMNNPLVINQWFADQAMADRSDILEDVKALVKHKAYDAKNPNSIRSLIGGFASNNIHFHNKNGSGYAFLADHIIKIDSFNPMVAAGLTKRLATLHKFDKHRQLLIKAQLQRILDNSTSVNVKEIASKSLILLTK